MGDGGKNNGAEPDVRAVESAMSWRGYWALMTMKRHFLWVEAVVFLMAAFYVAWWVYFVCFLVRYAPQ